MDLGEGKLVYWLNETRSISRIQHKIYKYIQHSRKPHAGWIENS